MEFVAAAQVPSLEPGETSVTHYLVSATSSMFHSLKASPHLGIWLTVVNEPCSLTAGPCNRNFSLRMATSCLSTIQLNRDWRKGLWKWNVWDLSIAKHTPTLFCWGSPSPWKHIRTCVIIWSTGASTNVLLLLWYISPNNMLCAHVQCILNLYLPILTRSWTLEKFKKVILCTFSE